jgi:hypothetical protein
MNNKTIKKEVEGRAVQIGRSQTTTAVFKDVEKTQCIRNVTISRKWELCPAYRWITRTSILQAQIVEECWTSSIRLEANSLPIATIRNTIALLLS